MTQRTFAKTKLAQARLNHVAPQTKSLIAISPGSVAGDTDNQRRCPFNTYPRKPVKNGTEITGEFEVSCAPWSEPMCTLTLHVHLG
jgi:hypothetical protein